MTTQAGPINELIDDVSALQSFLETVNQQPPHAFFIDVEGIQLSRNGSISILSIYIPEHNKTYLIDMHGLGSAAFTTSTLGVSLKGILEDSYQRKVIFDVRNDSDALFAHFQVSLSGVEDLQLMELSCRRGSRAFISGLARCVESDSGLGSAEVALWKQNKDRGTQLFAPEQGGRYEVFNERPLRSEMVDYCVQDVVIMKRLYDVYMSKLDDFWREEVKTSTLTRIQQSKSPTYQPHSREKARGPWSDDYIKKARRQWEVDAEANSDYETTARDCEGWEDALIMDGEPF